MPLQYDLFRETDFLLYRFNQQMQVISSAPLGGGITLADNFLNLKVPYNTSYEVGDFPHPRETLLRYCREKGLEPEDTVGMMTAADMDTFARVRESYNEYWVEAGITVGLGNARRAGDEADYNEFAEKGSLYSGTINIAVVSNLVFTRQAQVEAVSMIAEAKSAVLASAGVCSAKSGEIATGTGTDASALFSVTLGTMVEYCGKHVVVGQMLARSVVRALEEALSNYRIVFASQHWKK